MLYLTIKFLNFTSNHDPSFKTRFLINQYLNLKYSFYSLSILCERAHENIIIIGDFSETHRERTCLIGDSSETDMHNRRPIRDRHALLESFHYSNVNRQKVYKKSKLK